MAKLIGNNPSQIPTNGDLGSMAFEDRKNYATTSSPIYQPYRNIIINGDMSIAQRGTSATGLGNGDTGYHTCDRYRFAEAGSPTFEFTQSQVTDVPTGQGFATSLKMDCTTAQGSLASADALWLEQRTEAQNLQYLKFGTSSAESLTLSFWVKSSKTGTYICLLFSIDDTRHISQSYTINSANTWEKKTITFPGDTVGVIDNDNGLGFITRWYLGAGSDYSSGTLQTTWGSESNTDAAVGQVNLADSTSNDFYITGVQLEAGTTASDFEFLPHDVNLQRCQRYFELLKDETGETVICLSQGVSTSSVFGRIHFMTDKRAIPSASVSAAGHFQTLTATAGAWSTATGASLGSGDLRSIRLTLTGLSGMAAGNCHELRINDASGQVKIDSEL